MFCNLTILLNPLSLCHNHLTLKRSFVLRNNDSSENWIMKYVNLKLSSLRGFSLTRLLLVDYSPRTWG